MCVWVQFCIGLGIVEQEYVEVWHSKTKSEDSKVGGKDKDVEWFGKSKLCVEEFITKEWLKGIKT